MYDYNVESLIARAANQLRDTTFMRWSLAELCDYYNDAVRAVLLLRPDAGAQYQKLFPEQDRSLHELPMEINRLLSITGFANVYGGGGRALNAVSRAELNTSYPNWQHITGTPERYLYEPQTPRFYWLFPAPKEQIILDAFVTNTPAPVILNSTDGNTKTALGSEWVNPMLDWMLYRAFSKDADQGSQLQLAMQHYQAFSDQMNLKTRADTATAPVIPPQQ